MMNELISEEEIKKRTAPFLERGFAFEYFYQKGGDSSCVYICRFKKGKDFFDWREVSGANEIHLVVSVNGEYRFPDLEKRHPKTVRTFKRKHLFKKATLSDRRDLFAELLLEELRSSPADFFGISL
ncbi:MAG: hypothetical protein J6K50_03825 [Clostridia bacterium]|nr:hypothetical protein [Clostridia bacterium]